MPNDQPPPKLKTFEQMQREKEELENSEESGECKHEYQGPIYNDDGQEIGYECKICHQAMPWPPGAP